MFALIKSHFVSSFLSVLVVLTFTSCGGIDNESQSVSAKFIDATVVGLSYRCSSGSSLVTDSSGTFSCNLGDSVTFSLGEKIFKTLPIEQNIYTPYDIFPNEINSALNLARLLQSIDKDGNPNNSSIDINKTLEATLPSNLNYSASSFESDVESALSIQLVDAKLAQERMNRAILSASPSYKVPLLPTADAGLDINSTVNTTLTLNGSSSSAKNYTWVVLSKPNSSNVVFSSNYVEKPTFRADVKGRYELEFIVNKNDVNRVSDRVVINLKNITLANAGSDQNVSVNSEVHLDANASVGTSYRWEFLVRPTNSRAVLSDTTISNPTFLADINGTYKLELSVNSTDAQETKDSVTITAYSSNVDNTIPNTAPVLEINSSLSIHENQTNVFTIQATDKENNTLSYSLAGSDAASFKIDSQSGVVTLFSPADFESKKLYEFTAIVNDGNLTDSQNIALHILNVQEVPLLANSVLNIDENRAVSTVVGSLRIIQKGDSNISSIRLSGVNSQYFSVDSNGVVTQNISLDYELSKIYTLQAVATSNIGDSLSVSLIINVNNLSDTPPALVDTSLSVLENVSSGTEIGQITIATAGDTNITDITLVGSESLGFVVENNGTLSVDSNLTLDYERKKEYAFSAVARNGAGSSDVVNIVVYVNNVIDEVAVLSNFSTYIDENLTQGSPIGDINISYGGDSNISTIELSGAGYENFTLSRDGNITLSSSATLDYETKNSYSLLAVATNDMGKSVASVVYIGLNNIAEVAVLQETFLSVKENRISGDSVGVLNISYLGDTPISDINLSGVGSETFRVNSSGLVSLELNATLDFETKKVYTFKASATNIAGVSAEANVTISVVDYLYNPFQIAKIVADDGEQNDKFGTSVSVSGEYILVGAEYENTNGIVSAGSAYLFKKDGNGRVSQLAKIKASDPEAQDNFGHSVAIDGSLIVIGSPNEDSAGENAGSSYIYSISADERVTQIAKLVASNATPNANYGISVAISQNKIVVGADKQSVNANNSGSAYFYLVNGLSVTLKSIMTQNISGLNDNFGGSVAIDGDYIVVGAYGEDSLANDSGSVYVFKIDANTNSNFLQKLTAQSATNSDNFGISVDMSGEYLIVGAYQEDSVAQNAGSAYLFKRDVNDTFTLEQKIEASDATEGDNFGNSVSIYGKYIAIGAYKKSATLQNSGSVYVFEIDSNGLAVQSSKLNASDAQSSDYFGNSVSLSGDYIAVGAFGEDSLAFESGSVYLFDAEPVERIYHYNPLQNISNIDEGEKALLFNIDAQSPNSSLSYFLSGDDFDAFKNSGSSIENRLAFDYEVPTDIGSDNNYTLSVTMQDNKNNNLQINLSLLVNNRNYFLSNELNASETKVGDGFATSIASTSSYVVVGSPYSQSVYLYKKNSDKTLTEIAKIISPFAESNAMFGVSVAIDGSYIVVGASKQDRSGIDAGEAYLFKIAADESVAFVSRISASDASSGDNFGSVVSISASYIAVGAPSRLSNSGAVYLYKIDANSGVTQTSAVSSNGVNQEDSFAASLSLDGSYLVVGARGEDSLFNDSGAAYLFKISLAGELSEIAKLKSSDIEQSDNFGNSVAISGDYIVVGANYEDSGATDAGSAYVFKRNSDTQNALQELAKLQASDISSSEHFGQSVSVKNSIITVGTSSTYRNGSVYIYSLISDINISELQRVEPKISTLQSGYGVCVSISEDDIFVGSNLETLYGYKKDSN